MYNKMIGVYKITNPNGKIYIGQSINIERRWNDYRRLHNCKGQTKLYNSLKKYGTENHIFEVIEECLVDLIVERETFWKHHYRVLDVQSLCCKIDGKGGYLSDETKRKIGKSNSKPKPTTFPRGKDHKLTGTKQTEETKNKISDSNKGKIISEETRQKLKESCVGKNSRPKGYITSEETKHKISEAMLGKQKTQIHKDNISKSKIGKPTKKSTNIQQYTLDGIFIREWNKIKEASHYIGKPNDTASITACCRGKQKTAFGFIWRYK
jgi:hypothetical protein